MSSGIYSALAGAKVQETALDRVSHNLANANTTGFKAQHMTFSEVLVRADDGSINETMQQVDNDSGYTDFSQGTLRHTGNPLDLAIMGDGFFAVETPDGERYTRAGSLMLSPEGTLVTPQGYPLLGKSGPLTVSQHGHVRIDDNGMVWRDQERVDEIRVVQFADNTALTTAGHSMWKAAEGVIPEIIPGKLEIGAIEQSNVNAVQSMTEMVWLSRAYESYTKAMEIFSEIDRKTADSIR